MPDPHPYLSAAAGVLTTLNGDSGAVAAINAELPPVPSGDIGLSGQQAINYTRRLVQLIPSIANEFSNALKAVNCAFKYGLIAAMAYVNPTANVASVSIVVSKHVLTNPSIGLASCLVVSVVGGGPTPASTFNPQVKAFQYDATYNPTSFTDHYYVLLASTNPTGFGYFYGFYQRFSLTPIAR